MTVKTITRRRSAIMGVPWLWTVIGFLLEWVVLGLIAGHGMVETMDATLSYVPFLVLVAFGQMFVITLGNGNIDLSIPDVMSMSALVAVGVSGGGSGVSTLEGVVVGVIAGLVVGLINSIGILALKIPPIVCTLAVGLLAESATLVWSGVVTGTVPGTLMSITSARVGGIAAITWVCVPVSCLVALLLHRTKFGRSVQAIGQNIQAARLAGINVTGTITATYLLSGGLAAISGILLAAYGGLTVDLGTPYLLMSVAAVVLGGSLISGGRSNVTGIWAGALFLSFAVTLLEVLNTGVAGQDIGEGALILALLVVMRVARPRSVRTEERG